MAASILPQIVVRLVGIGQYHSFADTPISFFFFVADTDTEKCADIYDTDTSIGPSLKINMSGIVLCWVLEIDSTTANRGNTTPVFFRSMQSESESTPATHSN